MIDSTKPIDDATPLNDTSGLKLHTEMFGIGQESQDK